MDDKLKYYLSDLERNDEGVSDEVIANVQKNIDFTLPEDYLDLMRTCNGGEGEVGENSWLCLFPIDELIQTNQNYILLMEKIPDYFLFGKDAADTGFAFRKSDKSIHSFGLMSNFKTDPIKFCGNNFREFIEYLYNR